MNLGVHLFARVRERAGTELLQLDLPAGTTVGAVRDVLLQQFPDLQPLLDVCRIAVNYEFATDRQVVTDLDELAIIPPVSGG